jgi:hypothetical protein
MRVSFEELFVCMSSNDKPLRTRRAPTEQELAAKDFRRIPGVGPATAEDLWRLGYRSVCELVEADPESMYRELCVLHGGAVDRCCLYVFRCAVYFARCEAEGVEPAPELLKWWSWKDAALPGS